MPNNGRNKQAQARLKRPANPTESHLTGQPKQQQSTPLSPFLLSDKNSEFFQIFHKIEEEQAKATENAKIILKIIEEQGLGEKKYFGGDTIGLTDLAFGWIALWLEVIQEAAGVKVLEPNNFLRLQSWINNFKQLPIIKENIPDRNAMLHYFKRRRQMIIEDVFESLDEYVTSTKEERL